MMLVRLIVFAAPLALIVASGTGAPRVGALFGADVARNVSQSSILDQSAPGAIRLAQGQLPTIDRNTRPHDTASATRLANGHFVFETEVNGTILPMMFDTGASVVTLRAEDASRAGINVGKLQYTAHMSTANGIAEAAPTFIAEMKVGNITRKNIPASVAKPGALGVNLLGQSFLKMTAGFAEEGDQLVLRGN